MHAEVIAIGDEITSGQCLDTNTQWLSQQLEGLGIRVLYHTTVGDELMPCAEVFRLAIARADVVVATGGLGPTADDLTREALAEATGHPLQLDTDALDHVRTMFAQRNRPMAASNERQAMFPTGSRVVRNPHGTAPGICTDVVREGRGPCRFFCLPGVPGEMIEMWQESVAPAIAEFLGEGRRVIRRRLIHCFGAGESQVEAMLPDLIRRGRQPSVGITASKGAITLRITAEGATEEECLAAIAPVEATIRQCLGTLVVGAEDGP
jgi:nicotinamide-nucleotide amidase